MTGKHGDRLKKLWITASARQRAKLSLTKKETNEKDTALQAQSELESLVKQCVDCMRVCMVRDISRADAEGESKGEDQQNEEDEEKETEDEVVNMSSNSNSELDTLSAVTSLSSLSVRGLSIHVMGCDLDSIVKIDDDAVSSALSTQDYSSINSFLKANL